MPYGMCSNTCRGSMVTPDALNLRETLNTPLLESAPLRTTRDGYHLTKRK
jgi:hypothetical protein